MPTARVALYVALILVNLTAIVAWVWSARRRRLRDRPPLADVAIGFVANFLDTLGIGPYAQITALFKMRGRPAHELTVLILYAAQSLLLSPNTMRLPLYP